MTDFRTLIRKWETRSAFADAVGVKIVTAQKWYERNRIPVDSWSDVIDAAKSAGFEVDVKDLYQMVEMKKAGETNAPAS